MSANTVLFLAANLHILMKDPDEEKAPAVFIFKQAP